MYGSALLLPIPGYLLFGDGVRSGLSLSAIALWGIFLLWVYRHPRLQARSTPLGFATMVWAGILVIAALFAGDSAGGKALITRGISHTISTNQSTSDVEVTLFRPFEKGALIRPVNDERFRFIFWTEIKSVTAAAAAPTPFGGLVCLIRPAACRNVMKP